MIKVKLRDNKRLFESEDADFIIQAGEERELYTRVLKSYHIKNYLMHGHLKLSQGELLINVKHAKMLFSSEHPNICYGLEFGNFFKKDLDNWTLVWFHHIEENVPADIKAKLEGTYNEVTEIEEIEEVAEVAEVVEVVEVVDALEVKTEPKEFWTRTSAFKLKEEEQVELLKTFGLNDEDINKLTKEALRVNKILELQKEDIDGKEK